MLDERRKLKGLLDELISNALKAGATEIESKISEKEDHYLVYVKDNGRGMSEKKLASAHKLLNQPRRDELQEYYGELAGRTAKNSGLSIVGMMIDEYKLHSEKGQGTEVSLIMYKHTHNNND